MSNISFLRLIILIVFYIRNEGNCAINKSYKSSENYSDQCISDENFINPSNEGAYPATNKYGQSFYSGYNQMYTPNCQPQYQFPCQQPANICQEILKKLDYLYSITIKKLYCIIFTKVQTFGTALSELLASFTKTFSTNLENLVAQLNAQIQFILKSQDGGLISTVQQIVIATNTELTGSIINLVEIANNNITEYITQLAQYDPDTIAKIVYDLSGSKGLLQSMLQITTALEKEIALIFEMTTPRELEQINQAFQSYNSKLGEQIAVAIQAFNSALLKELSEETIKLLIQIEVLINEFACGLALDIECLFSDYAYKINCIITRSLGCNDYSSGVFYNCYRSSEDQSNVDTEFLDNQMLKEISLYSSDNAAPAKTARDGTKSLYSSFD